MPERIQIVDENDRPIGAATRQEALAKGLYYRLARIIIEDENGNLLLQKRVATKLLHPNRWTSAASGHVDEGESYETTALREIEEEIGATTKLGRIGTFLVQQKSEGQTVNQFNGVFRGALSHDTHFTIQPEEVSEVKWFTVTELKEKITENPDDFTPGLVEVIDRFYL